MSEFDSLKTLFDAIATGNISPDAALDKIKSLGYESVGEFAKVDRDRARRNGFPEVIWGAGKTPEQIVAIIEAMQRQNRELGRDLAIIATLVEPDVFRHLKARVPGLKYYPPARICAIVPEELQPKFPGEIAIVTAGTSDIPVAEEAAVTAELFGFRVSRLWDVGVAGIHRLLHNLHLIHSADVAIVVAGMEGALPSVVAGLVDCPVIAVPTSVGYGASFKGLAALLTMLNSCAPGIGVVNIDNGFGAAILAGQILRSAHKINRSNPL